jgi:ATP-dependent exoDNAse (exonuclease V) beta subunit
MTATQAKRGAEKSGLAGRQAELPDDATMLDRDAANRRKALDLNHSIIVQAPAGAGKTELLTQRFLGLLTTVQNPEQIVAMTFTRKAAAEMRKRILERLHQAAGPVPATAHARQTWELAVAAMEVDGQRGWHILNNPERLRITTIDALCASLVRQMPYLSRFGAMPAVAEKPEIHYAAAARQTIEAIEEFPAVVKALGYLDNDAGKLQRLIVAMLASRDQWGVHLDDLHRQGELTGMSLRGYLTASLAQLVERDLARVAAVLDEVQTPALMAAGRYVAAVAGGGTGNHPLRDWNQRFSAAAVDVSGWQALARMLMTTKGEVRKNADHHAGLPTLKAVPDLAIYKTHKDALQVACDAVRQNAAAIAALRAVVLCPAPHYTEVDLAVIETFVDVLKLACAFLTVTLQQVGETDFIGVASGALQALGDPEAPSELALKLDYELRHLLVDEFQDTNHHQISLLEKLTAGWEPQDGRTLFVVGDPMQSIYRFRKADVGLFLRTWHRPIGSLHLLPLALYRNNRSVPRVVDWINRAFCEIFPEQVDAERGRVTYSRAIPTKPDPAGTTSGVFIHPIITDLEKVLADDVETDDADTPDTAVAPQLAELVGLPADGDELEARKILEILDAEWNEDPTRNIAVLIRARHHLLPLVTEIRRSRPALRYEAVEIETLAARQPIQDLLALTRALCHRADRVNWLALLRAPWCGLTLADLLQLVRPAGGRGEDLASRAPRGPAPTVWSLMQESARLEGLSPDGQMRLLHVRGALAESLAHAGRQPLRRLVEGTWLRLGGNGCVATPADVADVQAFFRLLDTLDAGRFDLDRLEEDMRGLYAAPNTDTQAGRLKFMTIHKSKGLEFDTVILPGLHRRSRHEDKKLMIWEGTHDAAGNKHLVVAPYDPPFLQDVRGDGVEAGNSKAIRSYIMDLEKGRTDQEQRRVLYVAATRAMRSLHLLGVAKVTRNRKSGTLELNATQGTPLQILWPAVCATFEQGLADRQALLDLPQGLQAGLETPVDPAVDLAHFVPSLLRLPLARLPGPLQTPQGGRPRVDEVSLSLPGEQGESNLLPHVGTLVHRYLELIAQQGLAHWSADRIRDLRPIFATWLSQQSHDAASCQQGAERVEHALVNAVTDANGRWILQAHGACELALSHLEDGTVRNSIVDRTFVEDGIRWVIDYKTTFLEGTEIDAFVAAKCLEYAPQLERYAALLAQEGLPVRKAIYFVALNRLEFLN